VTLDEALALLSLPRVVGTGTDDEEITAQWGRFGPYLRWGKETRSLDTEEQIFSVTQAEAEALFSQPKRRGGRKAPIAELGAHPDSGAPVLVLPGRYGPYATDGTTNATIPRGTAPDSVTLDDAVALLRERAARGPAKKRAGKRTAKAKKSPRKTAKKAKKAAKATTKKSAKKTAKKSAEPEA